MGGVTKVKGLPVPQRVHHFAKAVLGFARPISKPLDSRNLSLKPEKNFGATRCGWLTLESGGSRPWATQGQPIHK